MDLYKELVKNIYRHVVVYTNNRVEIVGMIVSVSSIEKAVVINDGKIYQKIYFAEIMAVYCIGELDDDYEFIDGSDEEESSENKEKAIDRYCKNKKLC